MLPNPVLDHGRGVLCPACSQDGGTLLCVNLSVALQERRFQLDLLLSPAGPDSLVAKGHQAGVPGPDT